MVGPSQSRLAWLGCERKGTEGGLVGLRGKLGVCRKTHYPPIYPHRGFEQPFGCLMIDIKETLFSSGNLLGNEHLHHRQAGNWAILTAPAVSLLNPKLVSTHFLDMHSALQHALYSILYSYMALHCTMYCILYHTLYIFSTCILQCNMHCILHCILHCKVFYTAPILHWDAPSIYCIMHDPLYIFSTCILPCNMHCTMHCIIQYTAQ